MTNQEVLDLYHAARAFADTKSAPQFAYALVQNRKLIEPQFEKLTDRGKASPEFHEFENKRLALCRKMATRDEHDQPITVRDNYVIDPANQAEFDGCVAKLRDEYAEALEGHRRLQDEFKALLAEEAEVPSLNMMPLEALPAEITPRQIESLLPMVLQPSL